MYAEAQVAVVPSLYEGFSLPAIEAMACGVPLVATTGGALPEVVGDDGETALLVTPDDPEALAAGIRRILDDDALAARLGEGGRQRVLGRFTWEATARGTAEQYRLLLDDHRRAAGRRTGRGSARGGDRADRRLRTPRGGSRRAAARPRMRRGPSRLPGGAARGPGRGARRPGHRGRAGQRHHRRHGRRRRGALRRRGGRGPGRRPAPARSPTPASTASSPRRFSSTSPRTTRPWPSCPGCCGPEAPWPSPCHASAPRRSTGPCRTITTTSPGATFASTGGPPWCERLRRAGLRPVASHHAHALHSPYWWLRCWVGPRRDDHPAVRAYHRLLVWDIMRAPRLTRVTERVLNPLLGKSLVVYLEKPA